MNIRKIIREELDDFDWVRDQDPTSISDYEREQFKIKMVHYLGLDRKFKRDILFDIAGGETMSEEWATFNAFIKALEDLGETEFINWLMKKTLPQEVSRPYPYILDGIKEFGFDVNKSDETKRLYNIFYRSQPIFKRLKNKIFGENKDPLKWIKDVKTNDDIAQEIYGDLEWDVLHRRPHIVRNQWNDIPFSVIPSQKKESPIIIPSVFYKGYRDYMREKWGIYDPDIQKEIYFKIRYLMYQKVKNQNVNESDDFGWVDNSIEVGKCFMVNYPSTNLYMVKIIDIKQGKELKGVGGRKLMDIPKDSFNERAVKIKFAKMNYGSWRDDFEIYYPDVQDWIDWGWLTPTECE